MTLPPSFPADPTDQFVFGPNSYTVGENWLGWMPPKWATHASIFMRGAGGAGGNADSGGPSLSAGGGGGAAGGQTHLIIPLDAFPEMLFLSIAFGFPGNASTSVAAGISSYMSIIPAIGAPIANNVIAQANAGASGGAGTGSTAGPAGTAGAIATAGMMPLGWLFCANVLAGQAGIVGNGTTSAGALTLPVTGLLHTGGTGGAGMGAANTGSRNGGLIAGVAGSFIPANIIGGVGGAAGGANAGSTGLSGFARLAGFTTGGTGGGSSGSTAGGAYAAGGNGSAGGPGSGGGGGGGGNPAGIGGRGGDSQVIISLW